MSHEVESMAYKGEKPWHGLGTQVDKLMTSEEAIKAAGLDWTVSMQPVYLAGNKELTGWKAVQRDSDKSIYAVVGNGYVPVQNRDAFAFFDQVVNKKAAYYETCGSLRGGSRIWMLANLKGSLNIQGDEITRYLTLVNSHDGSLALQMFWTPVRVVCQNTLTMALSQATNSFYTRHTEHIRSRIYSAQEVLGLATKFYEDFEAKARAMAATQLPPGKMPLLLVAAFQTSGSLDANKLIAPAVQLQRQYNRVEELIEVGRGQRNPKIQGTIWQAYNGVAEYADYHKTYKDTTNDGRLYGSWFGAGANMKKRAWNWCVKELDK